MTEFALSQIYGTFSSKTVDLVKSLVEAEKKDANYDDIDVYAFFNS